jgi:hypothetical protein
MKVCVACSLLSAEAKATGMTDILNFKDELVADAASNNEGNVEMCISVCFI